MKLSEWIKVGDNNPKPHQKVIVSLNDGTVGVMFYLGDKYWDTHVVAWMPLPKAIDWSDEE